MHYTVTIHYEAEVEVEAESCVKAEAAALAAVGMHDMEVVSVAAQEARREEVP